MSNIASARPGAPGAPAQPIAYFKLKSSESYRFWRGRRLVDLKRGVVHAVVTKEDANYFRARPDVIVECDAEGKIMGGLGPGELDPKKAKSFKAYGTPKPKPGQKPVPPPPPVQVGKVMPAQPSAAPPPPMVTIPAGGVASPPGAPVAQGATAAPAPTVPTVPPPPPLDRKARSSRAQAAIEKLNAETKAEPMTPIERVDLQGKTEAKINVQR